MASSRAPRPASAVSWLRPSARSGSWRPELALVKQAAALFEEGGQAVPMLVPYLQHIGGRLVDRAASDVDSAVMGKLTELYERIKAREMRAL